VAVCPTWAVRIVVACLVTCLAAISLPARADDRTQLNACQTLIDRTAQSAQNAGAARTKGDAELGRCRQIIREWTLRDSRLTVDEHGRPLR
jgi:hypothetical protein